MCSNFGRVTIFHEHLLQQSVVQADETPLKVLKEDNNLIDLIDSGILTGSQAYIQVSRLNKERESRLIEEQE